MTDSTMEPDPGNGAFDVGGSVDDFFGGFATDADTGRDRAATDDDGGRAGDGVEDQTAADVFDQLLIDVDDEGSADVILADESPDDIIASADEPEPEPHATVDDDLTADDDELAALLLPGRSMDDGEFLWVDPEADDGVDSDRDNDSTPESVRETTPDRESSEGDADESVPGESEPEDEPDGDESAASDTDTAADESPVSNSNGDAGSEEHDGRTGVDDGNEADVSESEPNPKPESNPDRAADGPEPTRPDDSSGILSRLRSALSGLF